VIGAALFSAFSAVVAWVLWGQPAALSLAIAGVAGSSFLLGAATARRACDEASATFALLDRLPLAYVALDAERRVTAINERARRLLGWKHGESGGRYWRNLAGGWASDARAGAPKKYIVRWASFRPDGAPADILYQWAPLKIGGREMHLLLLQDANDIVAAFREESESARIRTAACLATQIAHEVRNPVAAISGCAQLLGILNDKARQGDERSSRLLLAEQDELCRSIVEESRRLDEIIGRFLSFSDLSEDSLRTVMELPENKEIAGPPP
jgi:signal transduction histidine kinase